MLDLDTRRWERIQVPQAGCAGDRGSWAPDGTHVVVTCAFPDRTFSIWYVALDGSESKPLVSNRSSLESSTYGELSHDGNSLLYGAVKDGRNQIFRVDVQTGRESQLTVSASDKNDAHWSADDRSIVYSAIADGLAQAWTMDLQSGKETVLTSGYERMRHVFFSPNGRWIYVQPSHRNIYRLPADAAPAQPITSWQRVTNFPEGGLFLEEPTISPDGKYFLYCRGRGGSSLWLLTLGGLSGTASPTTR